MVNKTQGRGEDLGDLDIDQPAARSARGAIGVVPQEIAADVFFTPRESMEVQAGMYGVPKGERRTMEILTALGLGDKADAYVRQLSGGMKRRLMVAKAMVHGPPVLILDEPTAGVDVELRRQLWVYVQELNAAGVTIVLTTHYLEEAQALCDRIAIVNHGRVVTNEPTRDLLRRLDTRAVVITPQSPLDGRPRPPRLRRQAAARRAARGHLQDRDRRGRTGAGGGARGGRGDPRPFDRGPGPGGRVPGPHLRRPERSRSHPRAPPPSPDCAPEAVPLGSAPLPSPPRTRSSAG